MSSPIRSREGVCWPKSKEEYDSNEGTRKERDMDKTESDKKQLK
jgi:hypothetical protein